jgi:hypothetical protein
MSSASLELQKAIIGDLKAHGPLMAIIAGVYDRVDTSNGGPAFPYLSWGPEQDLPVEADCIALAEISIQLDVWSRAVGYPECKTICDLVKRRLHNRNFTFVDNAFVQIHVEMLRYMRDPDGLTSHGVMTLKATVEEL